MFSVFPEYLVALAKSKGLTSSDKLKDTIHWLRNIHVQSVSNHQGGYQEDCPYLFCPNSRTEDFHNYIYKICTTKELRDVISWVYSNIILQADLYDITLYVRTRIATGMLNKLEERGIISPFENIIFHAAMIDNINRVMYVVRTEDLPF